MKAKLLASLLVLALPALALRAEEKPTPPAPAAQAPLQLADGRTFTGWSILNETATHVYVKHRGGGVKVAKQLLPAELRAVYPVDEDKARAEAAALAAAERAGNERKAMIEAERAKEYEARRAKSAAHKQAVDAAVEAARTERAIKRAIAADTPAPSLADDHERIYALVRSRATRYYETERCNGSGATLVFRVNCEFDEPRAVPGWPDRFEVTGTAHYQYYDSVWGGSFSAHRGYFTALVAGGKCLDFTPRSGPAM